MYFINKMSDVYLKYYALQAGAGYSNDDERFGQLLRYSPQYQRGRGLGGVFASLLRYLKPAFSSGLKFLKKEAVNTGLDLISGVGQQKPLKDILRDRSINIIDKLRDKAASKVTDMTGSGYILKRKTQHHKMQQKIKTMLKRRKSQKKCAHAKNVVVRVKKKIYGNKEKV